MDSISGVAMRQLETAAHVRDVSGGSPAPPGAIVRRHHGVRIRVRSVIDPERIEHHRALKRVRPAKSLAEAERAVRLATEKIDAGAQSPFLFEQQQIAGALVTAGFITRDAPRGPPPRDSPSSQGRFILTPARFARPAAKGQEERRRGIDLFA